ncbi:MAG: ParB N-terminal domain-containing protein, partial [Aestuariivirga sp.]
MTKQISTKQFQAPAGIVAAITAKTQDRRASLKKIVQSGVGQTTRRNDLTPMLKLENRKVSELRKASRQVRRANAPHITELKAGIEEFGFCVPPIVTVDGEIIDGHARIETTKILGISEIQCLVVGHLGTLDVRRLRIAINRIQEKGEWELPALQVELAE